MKEESLPMPKMPPLTSRVIRLTGAGLFVLSFFLPACSFHDPGRGDQPLLGWVCAWAALWMATDLNAYNNAGYLAVMSGLINPLILFHFFFGGIKKLALTRRIVAACIALFILATWGFFLVARYIPLIGLFLWVAGILMMLSAEVIRIRPTKTDSTSRDPHRAASQ